MQQQTITRRVSIQVVPVATTTVAGNGELQGDSGNGAASSHGPLDSRLLLTVLTIPLVGLTTGFLSLLL